MGRHGKCGTRMRHVKVWYDDEWREKMGEKEGEEREKEEKWQISMLAA